MARRRNQESRDREVGFGGFLGTAYGYVGTSIYVVLGGVALYALGVTPLVLLLVGVVVVVTSWSYAEASTAMPEASGVTSFARRTLGPLPGFAAAWGLLLDSIILVAIAASFIPHYLSVFWPQLQDRPYSTMCGIGVVALLLLLNVAGLRESVRLSSLVTALGLATLVLLIAVGFLTELKPDVVARQISLGTAPTWASLVFAIPLAAAAFVGLDAVSSRAESARDPARDVPRAIGIVLPLIIVLGIGLAVVALSAMPVTYNVVPVDATTGLTQQVPVVEDDAGGAFVLQSDPSVEVVVPVEQTDAGWVIPAQEPSGDVYERAGRPGDPALRHAGGQHVSAGPPHRHRRRPAGRSRLAPRPAAAVARRAHLSLAVPRRQRRRGRLRAHHLLAGEARTGAGGAGPRGRHAPDALHGRGPVRGLRGRPPAARGPGAPARAVRVRRRARLHRGQRVGDRAAVSRALALAAVRGALQRPLPRRPAARAGPARRGGDGAHLGLHGRHPSRGPPARVRLARRRRWCCTFSTGAAPGCRSGGRPSSAVSRPPPSSTWTTSASSCRSTARAWPTR